MHFLFKRFTPLTNVVDPESVAIGKALCAYKFQHRPLLNEHILIAPPQASRLRGGSIDAEVPNDDLGSFFREQNPNFLSGDELVCVARVTDANYTKQFARVMRGIT